MVLAVATAGAVAEVEDVGCQLCDDVARLVYDPGTAPPGGSCGWCGRPVPVVVRAARLRPRGAPKGPI